EPLQELTAELSNRRVAPGASLSLRSASATVRVLLEHCLSTTHRPKHSCSLCLNGPSRFLEETAQLLPRFETSHGNLGEREVLVLCPPWVEARPGLLKSVSTGTTRPVEPLKATRLAVFHLSEGGEPRPVGALANQPFLHPVRQDIPEAVKQRGVVQDGLGRVARLPERSTPPDQDTDLLGDVRKQVLHEPGQVSARRTKHQVQVRRHHREGEELDLVLSNSARKYTAEDCVRLMRRTEEATTLRAANRNEVDLLWNKHSKRPPQGCPPCAALPLSTRQANEPNEG